MNRRIYHPAPPSALAQQIKRRAQVPMYLAQHKADLMTGAIYGD